MLTLNMAKDSYTLPVAFKISAVLLESKMPKCKKTTKHRTTPGLVLLPETQSMEMKHHKQ